MRRGEVIRSGVSRGVVGVEDFNGLVCNRVVHARSQVFGGRLDLSSQGRSGVSSGFRNELEAKGEERSLVRSKGFAREVDNSF